MGIFNFKFGKKKQKFALNKEAVLELSDREKELISEHRKKMDNLEREQEAMQTIMRAEMNRMMPSIADEADRPVYLYDILGGWHAGNNEIRPIELVQTMAGTIETTQDNAILGTVMSNGEVKTDAPRQYKPIDVWKELENVPDLLSMENIDDKIKVLNMKKDLIGYNSYAKGEMIDMVQRLENRKKYEEFKEFFEQFDNTTTEKIVELVSKYKLVLKTSDLFIAAFPDEAIMIMKAYVDNVKALCGKTPVFYVIAEEQMFKDEYKKKDPILLAQSPFGCYWQVLGAWDKEMILLQEL